MIHKQEALQMQRDHMTCNKYEILYLKRLAIANHLQGHSRSLQLLTVTMPIWGLYFTWPTSVLN